MVDNVGIRSINASGLPPKSHFGPNLAAHQKIRRELPKLKFHKK